jgi:hypothetical protein
MTPANFRIFIPLPLVGVVPIDFKLEEHRLGGRFVCMACLSVDPEGDKNEFTTGSFPLSNEVGEIVSLKASAWMYDHCKMHQRAALFVAAKMKETKR